MEIGKKIRELRIARNLTQEALAAELSVTPQAISKWECGTTTPDIQLLPDIAIFFGITLDELFCLTDDNELDRIQNQIWDSRLLPQAELERAERFLQSRIEAGYRPGRCWCLRAQLHNHQAQQHHALELGEHLVADQLPLFFQPLQTPLGQGIHHIVHGQLIHILEILVGGEPALVLLFQAIFQSAWVSPEQ